MLLHNKTTYTGALKVHHFHLVRRPTVPVGLEDISTKTRLLPRQALGLLTIRNSMARRNRITVHSPLVLLPALSTLLISHTYRLLISQLAANTSQVTEANLTQHPRPTPPINLLLHHPDPSSSGMAIALLPKSDQTQDCNTPLLPQSCRIGNSHYLLYRLLSPHLRARPIHPPLPRPHHSHQVEMHFPRTPLQHLRSLTRKESLHQGIQVKDSLIARLHCIISYLLCPVIHRTAVRASHLQLSIAGLLV